MLHQLYAPNVANPHYLLGARLPPGMQMRVPRGVLHHHNHQHQHYAAAATATATAVPSAPPATVVAATASTNSATATISLFDTPAPAAPSAASAITTTTASVPAAPAPAPAPANLTPAPARADAPAPSVIVLPPIANLAPRHAVIPPHVDRNENSLLSCVGRTAKLLFAWPPTGHNLAQLLAARRQPHKLLALAEQLRGGVLVPLRAPLDTAVFAGSIHATLTLEPGILASAMWVSGSTYAAGLCCLAWELEACFEAPATIDRYYVDQLRLFSATPRKRGGNYSSDGGDSGGGSSGGGGGGSRGGESGRRVGGGGNGGSGNAGDDGALGAARRRSY